MSDKLSALLAGEIKAGVYRFTSRAGAAGIAEKVQAGGWRFFYLDGQKIATKAEFLRACAAAMEFPPYFGHNWDALEECLRDLSWAPGGRGYLALYDSAGRFAEAHPEDFAVALSILKGAVSRWRSTKTPLTVLLRGMGRAGAEIPTF